jgi:hypothetical protein
MTTRQRQYGAYRYLQLGAFANRQAAQGLRDAVAAIVRCPWRCRPWTSAGGASVACASARFRWRCCGAAEPADEPRLFAGAGPALMVLPFHRRRHALPCRAPRKPDSSRCSTAPKFPSPKNNAADCSPAGVDCLGLLLLARRRYRARPGHRSRAAGGCGARLPAGRCATGTVLAESNADEQLPPASLTKLMTGLRAGRGDRGRPGDRDDQVA